MQSGPYVKRVLSSSRWMAAARPATGMPLLQPVLTQQPSLSPLHHWKRRACAPCGFSAKAGGPCGRTAPSHGESGRGEYVHDLDCEPLASGKLYPPLTRTVARSVWMLGGTLHGMLWDTPLGGGMVILKS